MREETLNFLRTGYYNRSEGYIASRVLSGLWWSDTNSLTTNGYDLYIYPTGIAPQHSDYRGYGFAVRCVVREG